MKSVARSLVSLTIGFALSGCATASQQSRESYLTEDEVIDLMQHPREWDGRVVTIRIYPFDGGFERSAIVCFEPCDDSYAESSPFLVITRDNKFRGYRGDRAVVITARYSSSCFYTPRPSCPDLRYGQFTEIEPR